MSHTDLQATFVKFANLIFDFDKKLLSGQSDTSLRRICDKMKNTLADAGILVINPVGEPYLSTRTDVEANIVGDGIGKLVITEVLKPVVYSSMGGVRELLQRGVVIVSVTS
jgi:hypothetical protein